MKINLEDTIKANIRPYLTQTYEFINSLLERNECVLVFCRAGVSRSASVIIHYLMKRFYLSYYDAYHYLKTKRKHIQPNEGFVNQLIEAEEKIKTHFLEGSNSKGSNLS